MKKQPQKQFYRLSLATAITLSLAACGGSESEPTSQIKPPATNYSLGGKVIDGYVSGATVWLDLNNNGELDGNEPSTTSTDFGEYYLEFDSEEYACAPYAAIEVHVPAGAIDEELGEVTEAYNMSLPPAFEALDDDAIKHATPLTSVVWGEVKRKLKNSGKGNLTCNELAADQELRYAIKSELEQAIQNVVGFYNISEEQISADYIANNDSEAHEIAKEIVKGFKAGYRHRAELEKQHPDASDIYVMVFQEKDELLNDRRWVRYSIVSHPTEYVSETAVLNNGLSEVETILGYRFYSEDAWNEGKLGLTTTIDYREEEGLWSCFNEEQVEFEHGGIKLDLINATPSTRESSFEDCQQVLYGNGAERGYGYTFESDGIRYGAVFTISKDDAEYGVLSEWHNIKDKESTLKLSDLGDYFLSIPYFFDDPITLDLNRWQKTKAYTDDDGNGIDINKFGTKDSNEVIREKVTSYSDNTHKKECSTDGENWTECS